MEKRKGKCKNSYGKETSVIVLPSGDDDVIWGIAESQTSLLAHVTRELAQTYHGVSSQHKFKRRPRQTRCLLTIFERFLGADFIANFVRLTSLKCPQQDLHLAVFSSLVLPSAPARFSYFWLSRQLLSASALVMTCSFPLSMDF